MSKLQDKIAIVTGASRGIGYAVAEAFAREGAVVVLCGSRQKSADQAAAKLLEANPMAEVIPMGVDVTDSAAIAAMVARVAEKYGHIDVLVNNAGITSAKSILEMEDSDFTDMIDINLTGPFKCIREVAKHMVKTGGGSIINTSSMVGTYGGKMQTAYAASKFGINGLTKSCAKELGQYNIRVNAVAPGVVATDMVQQSVDDRMQKMLAQLTPLGRMASPQEMAMAYVYLASAESSFTTGAILHIDGGLMY